MTLARQTLKIFKTGNRDKINLSHQRFDGKVAVLNYPPLWVTVGITGSCAFKCDFCCSHSPDSGANEKTSHQYKMPYTMSLYDFKRVVDMCYEAGVPRVHICAAGEPFLHPRILEFMDYEISVYSHLSLQTDFWKRLFEKKNFVDEIIKRGNAISSITTDIFPEEMHEKIKKGSDFDYLLHCMEKISRKSDIIFDAHVILTKKTYKGLPELVCKLHRKNIRFYLNIVNLFPLGFNEFTSMDNVYLSSDTNITDELRRLRHTAEELDVKVNIPKPLDKTSTSKFTCPAFWQKVQLIPSKKLPKERWRGNTILQQCPATVIGDIFSVGNLFDFDNFMDFWNNDALVGIRKKIIAGEMPDEACRLCYLYADSKYKNSSVQRYFRQFNFLLNKHLFRRTKQKIDTL